MECREYEHSAGSSHGAFKQGTFTDGARSKPPTVGRRIEASPGNSTAVMVTMLFDQAEKRDPTHGHRWIVRVDGAEPPAGGGCNT